MRRFVAVAVASTAITGLTASQAFGFHCFVAKKPAGAGSAGSATIEVTTETFTPGDDLRVNPAGKTQGAFITLTATFQGEPIGTFDVFAHGDLPEGAHNSGPGDNECDGIGVDDAIACLGGE
jgi:hypothetical protein